MTLNEIKNQKTLIGHIVTTLSPTIDELVSKQLTWLEKETKRPASKFDKEYFELFVIWDLVKSIEKYTEPTDTLVELSSSTSNKGNLEIFSKIKRDGIEYSLYTEVIYAGGYNIQKLHYRYLTKSKLPKTWNDENVKRIHEEMKKLSKVQRLEEEIIRYEKLIHQTNLDIISKTNLTDEEKFKYQKRSPMYYEYPTYEELSDYGKEYHGSPEKYKEVVEGDYYHQIKEFDKLLLVERYRVIELQKPIDRLRKRIKLLK